MNEVIVVDILRILPTQRAVLRAQGVHDAARVSAQARDIADQAVVLCAKLARPRALLEEIDADSFAALYTGEGLNQKPAPLEQILPQARHLALIAATLGDPISKEIERRFADGDLAVALALDAAASEAADDLSAHLAREFHTILGARGDLAREGAVLCYSPGYCGWHICAQRGLLARVRPERIGITLRQSCLMQPIKSVSGVLIEAPLAAHQIQPRYDFCSSCRSKSCVSPARQRLIKMESQP